jgi:large conductance mechanosensitive channel
MSINRCTLNLFNASDDAAINNWIFKSFEYISIPSTASKISLKKKIMLKEFKAFISKGNVLDLAVGLILATYFGSIVKSLVDDIIMPPIGLLLKGVDFKELQIVIQEASIDAEGVAHDAISLNYGAFINNVITFFIVAFAVFMVVKAYNKMKKKQDAAAPKEPSNEEKLLGEIRDLLKQK